MGAAMARHPILSDEEILARARSVFVEQGYSARTKQISAAVGLTWGAIALRFGDKRELFTQAMTTPVHLPGEPACTLVGAADLPSLVQWLRSHLWERWPLRLQMRLQMRLAETSDHADGEQEALLRRLAAALAVHARHGSIRSDMGAEVLARIVLALVTGDVAQRFVTRERALPQDREFVDQVVRLLDLH